MGKSLRGCFLSPLYVASSSDDHWISVMANSSSLFDPAKAEVEAKIVRLRLRLIAMAAAGPA